ncbi:hypothetical protein F5Y19DRAFT_357098 [Xylariaceae sp. FL1651]|nr:hypothetical protein F5Y19DRAFT_357098 [Xylariaceae sp. FL1651]
MANGFEKLERLLTGSKRRERGRHRTAQQQKTPAVVSRQPSSPVFPSPSYLRPTSIHMMPRDAQIDGPERRRGRSQSVPGIQEALHKRSSAASSVTVVNNRSGLSEDLTSSLRRDTSRSSQTTPRLSRFRFPEDSLLKNHGSLRSSGETDTKDVSREPSPRGHATGGHQGKQLLDWTPKHISLLFNPLEFSASSNDRQWRAKDDGTESTLLPSPDFTPLIQLPKSYEFIGDGGQQPAIPPLSLCSPIQKVPLYLKQQSLPPCGQLFVDSPPASDSDEEDEKPSIHRSMSLTAPSLASPNATRIPSHGLLSMGIEDTSGNRRNVRETWGNRLEDPRLCGSPNRNSDGILWSRFIRKSASTSTLSILASQIAKDQILKEPTFDDFYALNDDDIAESRPPTPAYDDARVPPTPPPKDPPKSKRKNRPLHALTSQSTIFKTTYDEITPPCSPTHHHLLALTYSPTSPLETLGALWAADLARKYDFAVLYVLSLWPVGGDNCLGHATNASVAKPQSTDVMATEKTSTFTGSTTGRLLAAYGLNEVPSPFGIVTEIHMAALNCDNWNEYRNTDALPEDISRGWIRPFYSDYDPVSTPTENTDTTCHEHPKNRGILFAAYIKQTSKLTIPLRVSPEQDLLLQQLYYDAEALVGALVEYASRLRDTP